MNFWCFLVTPDDQHIITSSISASAASVLQHHWCINTNSISVSAESLHQQHTFIISISTSVASLHQQRHCISAYSHQQYQHIISISASTTQLYQQDQCISRILASTASVHKQNTRISSVPKSLVFNTRTRIIRAFEEKCSYNARILCDLGHLLRVVSCSSQFNHMATILQCSESNLRTSFKTKTLILLIFSPYFACFFVAFCSYFLFIKCSHFAHIFIKKELF